MHGRISKIGWLVGWSPGQNATGQNATNSGICFYFLQMLFQFVVAANCVKRMKIDLNIIIS